MDAALSERTGKLNQCGYDLDTFKAKGMKLMDNNGRLFLEIENSKNEIERDINEIESLKREVHRLNDHILVVTDKNKRVVIHIYLV